MFDYCNSNDFEKAVDYNDIRYYRIEDDIFNAQLQHRHNKTHPLYLDQEPL